MPHTLPRSLDAITAEWINSALAACCPGARVRAIQPLTSIHGTATKIQLRIDYEPGASGPRPSSLWVKGGFAAHSQMMAPIYAIESRFYREIAPELDILLPACYFAAEDADGAQAIVLLEDLARDDISLCRVQSPLNFAQMAANLDNQARLHARWWNHPALDDPARLGWVQRLDPMPEGERGTYQRGQLVAGTYASYMALPRGAAVPTLFHDSARMAEAMERLRQVDREQPHCLLHGDTHLGNMYFTRDGGAGILDWQAVSTGPWSHDVAYFIVSALDVQDRRRWEKALLTHYLECLRRHGASPVPSFDSAWRAYVQQFVYGLFYWLVNPVDFQSEVNNCAVAPRFAMAALDHDTLGELGV